MVTRYKVSYIHKLNRNDPHKRIQLIGGVYPDTAIWDGTEEEVILAIESKEYEFFVEVGLYYKTEVIIEVVRSSYGYKCLKTKPDATKEDNLLSLPDFPDSYYEAVRVHPFRHLSAKEKSI